ncbi:hypothetical protein FQN50_006790 [Emmonsiellopsis sp. PD_5]|nr:hypothetical protein FQN50_006790 [Emmonsiellopsis sp. PD_5]
MARRTTVRAPTSASLPDSLRIPSTTPSLLKALGKLSRPSLLSLVLQWLDDKSVTAYPPYLGPNSVKNYTQDEDDETNAYPPADSIEELRGIYEDLRARKGGKREVIDRILEGDWRHGITLRQLAMVDVRYIEDHPVGYRWTALQLVPIKADTQSGGRDSNITPSLPRFHGSTFIRSLHREISPLVKAHYHISRSQKLPLTFVRIFVVDSPYQQPRQSPYIYTDTTRIIYLAFPDSSPYIYSSVLSPSSSSSATTTKPTQATTATTDTRTLRRLVKDAVPLALSRPQERYTLEPTSLTAKSLHTLLALRGAGRTNCANGAFTIFADAVVEGCPLDPRLPGEGLVRVDGVGDGKENVPLLGQEGGGGKKRKKKLPFLQATDSENAQVAKKRKLAVNSRFGTAGLGYSVSTNTETQPQRKQQKLPIPQPALDRLSIRLLDPISPPTSTDNSPSPSPSDNEPSTNTTPTISLTLSGSHVIAGLRRLAELGVVDAARMPGWMSGEEGVSEGVVKGGLVRGKGG